jgi:hypothetical protein
VFGCGELADALISLRVGDEGVADSLGRLFTQHRCREEAGLVEVSLLAYPIK